MTHKGWRVVKPQHNQKNLFQRAEMYLLSNPQRIPTIHFLEENIIASNKAHFSTKKYGYLLSFFHKKKQQKTYVVVLIRSGSPSHNMFS